MAILFSACIGGMDNWVLFSQTHPILKNNKKHVLFADAFLVQIVYLGPGSWNQGRAFFLLIICTVGWYYCMHCPVIVRVVGNCWARMPGPYGSQRLRQNNFATLELHRDRLALKRTKRIEGRVWISSMGMSQLCVNVLVWAKKILIST